MHQLKRFPQAWTKDLFDNLTLWCMGDDIDEEWGLGKKLTEKAGCVLNPHDIEGEPAYAECVAVYCCRQARGPSVGKEAIVKVRIQ